MRIALKILPVLVIAALLGTCSTPPTQMDQIRTLGELRVITRNSPVAFYLGPEGPIGPEYELVKGFADYLDIPLKIIIKDRFDEIIPEIATGKAHMAAAGLTITRTRGSLVSFGPPYQEVKEFLVYRQGQPRPKNIKDIIGAHIEVLTGSSHAETLHKLRNQYPDLVWVENPNSESEELLYRVAEGDIDYTIADSTEFAISRNFHPEIRVAFDIRDAGSVAWAFNRSDYSLQNAASGYIANIKQSGELYEIIDKYYGRTDHLDYVSSRSFMRHIQSRLPQYRTMFETSAEETGIDWHLLAAIGYQESHWNPHAVSPTGVRGIMMLTQVTAGQMGIKSRIDPEQSIKGGARYYSLIRDRIAERIPEPDRTWLALAAYNVGYGHLEDARIITQMRGMNADRWSDVKQSLPLLTQQKWYSQVRRGYARGYEPVRYVENIRSYYDILIWITGDERWFPPEQDFELEELKDSNQEPIVTSSG